MVWSQMLPEDSAFTDLRRLADWFASLSSLPHRSLAPGLIERVVSRLGVTCIPLLGREMCVRSKNDAHRRDAARNALAQLAGKPAIRPRVIAELRRIAASDAC